MIRISRIGRDPLEAVVFTLLRPGLAELRGAFQLGDRVTLGAGDLQEGLVDHEVRELLPQQVQARGAGGTSCLPQDTRLGLLEGLEVVQDR